MPQDRVQKILAQAGIASRRKAEDLIREGVVTINGRTAQLGDKAEWGKDAIKVRGKLITQKEAPTYIALNKPRGVISMMQDPGGRPALADYVTKVKARLFPIGRLDFLSEGLILLTNDGEFAEKLSKREDIPRVYHVKVKGHPTHEMLERISRGMRFENQWIRPDSVRIHESLGKKSYVEVVIMGSGAQDIRALFETRGFLVDKMVRASIGQITLHGLEPGLFKVLEKSQVESLLSQPELGLRMLDQKHKKKDRLQPPTPEELALREEARSARLAQIRERNEPSPIRPRGEAGDRGSRHERSDRAERPAKTSRPSRGPARPPRAGKASGKKRVSKTGASKTKKPATPKKSGKPTSRRSAPARSKK